ncbi:MAG: hypothetical protein KME20_19185 [Kaiparowitsia implicata GSE-PSE-MK54-09C]|nr:hypothetical protein [Kaiparowitsia implicata GSE-PSE-MK54-09C]
MQQAKCYPSSLHYIFSAEMSMPLALKGLSYSSNGLGQQVGRSPKPRSKRIVHD